MRTELHQVVGVALAGVITCACAGGASVPADRDAPRDVRPVVVVTNNNWLDVNIYAVRAGARSRLGTVTSLSTGTFAVPPTMVANGAVMLLTAPIGSPRTHRTDRIMVGAGDRIELNVENSLSLSHYTVRYAGPR